MIRFLARQAFLIIGLLAVAYFFVVDLKTLRPGFIDYAIFGAGFVAMVIYVVQSFLRLRGSSDGSRS